MTALPYLTNAISLQPHRVLDHPPFDLPWALAPINWLEDATVSCKSRCPNLLDKLVFYNVGTQDLSPCTHYLEWRNAGSMDMLWLSALVICRSGQIQDFSVGCEGRCATCYLFVAQDPLEAVQSIQKSFLDSQLSLKNWRFASRYWNYNQPVKWTDNISNRMYWTISVIIIKHCPFEYECAIKYNSLWPNGTFCPTPSSDSSKRSITYQYIQPCGFRTIDRSGF